MGSNRVNLKKILLVVVVLVVLSFISFGVYIAIGDLDKRWIQREGYTFESLRKYLSGEQLQFIDYFTFTGEIKAYGDKEFDVATEFNTYKIILDSNTYVAIDSSYEGKGVLPNGGYVGSSYETVLNALRIGSTITVWGVLQEDGVVKVSILHLLKQ